jgi:hypothetical protein
LRAQLAQPATARSAAFSAVAVDRSTRSRWRWVVRVHEEPS